MKYLQDSNLPSYEIIKKQQEPEMSYLSNISFSESQMKTKTSSISKATLGPDFDLRC
jgi:hypothetical protein